MSEQIKSKNETRAIVDEILFAKILKEIDEAVVSQKPV